MASGTDVAPRHIGCKFGRERRKMAPRGRVEQAHAGARDRGARGRQIGRASRACRAATGERAARWQVRRAAGLRRSRAPRPEDRRDGQPRPRPDGTRGARDEPGEQRRCAAPLRPSCLRSLASAYDTLTRAIDASRWHRCRLRPSTVAGKRHRQHDPQARRVVLEPHARRHAAAQPPRRG